MKEITSVKTGKIQIISDEVWDNIVGRGWDKKYTVLDIPERKLREVPVIDKPLIKPVEIKTKTKKVNG